MYGKMLKYPGLVSFTVLMFSRVLQACYCAELQMFKCNLSTQMIKLRNFFFYSGENTPTICLLSTTPIIGNFFYYSQIAYAETKMATVHLLTCSFQL